MIIPNTEKGKRGAYVPNVWLWMHVSQSVCFWPNQADHSIPHWHMLLQHKYRRWTTKKTSARLWHLSCKQLLIVKGSKSWSTYSITASPDFATLAVVIFLPLYLALVRPISRYDQQASSLYLRRNVYLMDRIQDQETRTVKGMRDCHIMIGFVD